MKTLYTIVGGINMELVLLVGFLTIWILLQAVILPRLGVQT
jgi:hypothetical protein